MIFDRIENAATYRGTSPRLAAALEYLAHTDFTQLAPGKYELDGDKLFASVARFTTKPLEEEITWEAHRKYADVQYVVSGNEKMGCVNLQRGLTSNDLTIKTPYNPDGDIEFFRGQGPFLHVHAGEFAVFFPQDVHAPCLTLGSQPEEVVKVVAKVRLE